MQNFSQESVHQQEAPITQYAPPHMTITPHSAPCPLIKSEGWSGTGRFGLHSAPCPLITSEGWSGTGFRSCGCSEHTSSAPPWTHARPGEHNAHTHPNNWSARTRSARELPCQHMHNAHQTASRKEHTYISRTYIGPCCPVDPKAKTKCNNAFALHPTSLVRPQAYPRH